MQCRLSLTRARRATKSRIPRASAPIPQMQLKARGSHPQMEGDTSSVMGDNSRGNGASATPPWEGEKSIDQLI